MKYYDLLGFRIFRRFCFQHLTSEKFVSTEEKSYHDHGLIGTLSVRKILSCMVLRVLLHLS